MLRPRRSASTLAAAASARLAFVSVANVGSVSPSTFALDTNLPVALSYVWLLQRPEGSLLTLMLGPTTRRLASQCAP
jgi:hypothetical protein